MRKRPGNAVKPLPACVDVSFHRHLATNTILTPQYFVKVPPGIASLVFHIVGSNLYQRWGCMSCIPRPFKREEILKTVRATSFFTKQVTRFQYNSLWLKREYPRIQRCKDLLGHYWITPAPLSYWKHQSSVPNRYLTRNENWKFKRSESTLTAVAQRVPAYVKERKYWTSKLLRDTSCNAHLLKNSIKRATLYVPVSFVIKWSICTHVWNMLTDVWLLTFLYTKLNLLANKMRKCIDNLHF